MAPGFGLTVRRHVLHPLRMHSRKLIVIHFKFYFALYCAVLCKFNKRPDGGRWTWTGESAIYHRRTYDDPRIRWNNCSSIADCRLLYHQIERERECRLSLSMQCSLTK